MRQLLIVRLKNIRYLSTPIPNIDKNKNKYDKNKDIKKENNKLSYLRMYNCLPIKIDKEDKINNKTK
jgi:hypothetical protein